MSIVYGKSHSNGSSVVDFPLKDSDCPLYLIIIDGYGGVHKWGSPHSWMVYFRENANLKMKRTRGTPILGNLHISGLQL